MCVFRFEDLRDAEDALHHLDGHRLNGKRMEIQYAQGDRKSKWQVLCAWRTSLCMLTDLTC